MSGIIVYSTYKSGEAADDAVQGQKDAAASTLQATEKNIDFQKWLWGEQRALLDPYSQAGINALGDYNELVSKPLDLTLDPGYQFSLSEGTKARENSASARGMQLSGAQQKALTRFGTDYASTKYNEAFNRRQIGLDNLYRMIMTGQAASAGQAQTGTSMGNQVSSAINMGGMAMNQMYQNIGNIQASREMAPYNTLMDIGNLAVGAYGAYNIGKS